MHTLKKHIDPHHRFSLPSYLFPSALASLFLRCQFLKSCCPLNVRFSLAVSLKLKYVRFKIKCREHIIPHHSSIQVSRKSTRVCTDLVSDPLFYK